MEETVLKTESLEKETLEEEVKEDKEKKLILEFPKIGEGKYIEGIGRRKTSSARVRIYDKTRKTKKKEVEITINDRDFREYFHNNVEFIKIVQAPLKKIHALDVYRVTVKVHAGGTRGQAEAIRLGLARALIKLNSEWRPIMKKAGFLTRDPRMVERKKYGQRKARKDEQWSKR